MKNLVLPNFVADFFSFLPPYRHGHRDCHHLPLILFSAGDVPAFVFVFCFLKAEKTKKKKSKTLVTDCPIALLTATPASKQEKKKRRSDGGSG